MEEVVAVKEHKEADGTARIQSVDRAIDLLLAVAAAVPTDATVPALARACGLNRATAWRLLKTLQARGMVAVDATTGRYSLGLTAVELAGAAGPDTLIAAAHPVLERTCTQTGETASLAVPGMSGLTYVDEVTPTAVLMASRLGRTVPLHATSTGKALLAFLPAAEVRRVLSRDLPSFTDTTVTTADALAEDLAATRSRGYGTCAGELESALYGVSAPVLIRGGRPLAALSIWGPRHRVPEQRFATLGSIAVQAARQLGSARLTPGSAGGHWPETP